MRAGAFHEVKPANDEVRSIISALREDILSRMALSPDIGLEAQSFTSRAVLGGNFTIKVLLSNGNTIQVKANKLPSGPVLLSVVACDPSDFPIES